MIETFITSRAVQKLTPGKIKMTDQAIIFKNSKTGKVEQFPSAELDVVNFQNIAGSCAIRIFLKNGNLHRFVGFKEGEKEKIAKFFTTSYKKDTLEKELSLKGWNWGTAKFTGSVLSFDIGNNSAFEIPLNHVSQCNTGKNEITMEFHQNDDAPVSLMEMRFFIPSNELAGEGDAVEAFQQQVMTKASVISVSGDAIAIFREIHCLTPRGRYDIKIFHSFFQLHGKTFDYKIPISTVLRLFVLPHKDSRQMFFVVSLDPPIKQGQTRYHFLVLLFGQEDETSLELPFTDEELKEKYEDKLEKELSGPTYEVLGKIMKTIINRKLTGPGNFIGNSGTPAVGCSFKAAAGYLYPLERGFIYIHKPPIHIRFEEIASVNFARGGGSTRSFDFEIELKSGTVHTFSNIEKEEYTKLYDFCTSKKLHVKNRGKNVSRSLNDKPNYADDFGDSDNEHEPDAYLAKIKAEAEERDDDPSDDESTDEDFNPNAGGESDVAEEFDSNHSSSSSDEGSGGGGGSGDEARKEKKKQKKEKREKRKTKTISEKPRKSRKSGKERDANKPKKPQTGFMLWLNETREKIKEENPGIKVTEIAKKGGEMWREMKDKSEWEKKAVKAKEDYAKAMKEYEESGGAAAFAASTADKESKSKTPSKKKTANVPPPKSGFKSKEYIEDSESSDDDEKKDSKGGGKRKGSDVDSSEERDKKKAKSKKDDSDKDSGEDKDESESEKGSDDEKVDKKGAKGKDDKGKDAKAKDGKSKKASPPKKPSRKDDSDVESEKGSGSEKSSDDEKDDKKGSKGKGTDTKKNTKAKDGKGKKASPPKKSSKKDDSDADSAEESGKKGKGGSDDDELSEEILSTPPSSDASDDD